jgi:hypothetical protein
VIASPATATPFLAIELGRRRFIDQPIIAASPHAFRGCRPPTSGTASGLNDEPATLGVEFHFLRQICFVEQRSGNPDAPGVPDLHNPGLRRHVITV